MEENLPKTEIADSVSDTPDIILQPAQKGKKQRLVVRKKPDTSLTRGNALKHGLYSKMLMADLCDKCALRPKEQGGSIGGCDQYIAGSICNVKKDLKAMADRFNTREPDKLRDSLDELYKVQFVRLGMSLKTEAASGNLNDKVVRAEINTLLEIAQMADRLNSNMAVARQTEEFDEKGKLMKVMREVLIKRTQKEQGDGKTSEGDTGK